MRRTEMLLLALMSICIFGMLSACGKKDDNSAATPAYPNPNMTYTYNQRPCSERIIEDYERVINACDNQSRRQNHRRQKRHCEALTNAFLAQYPQINCSMEVYARSSSRYKNTAISEDEIRRYLH